MRPARRPECIQSKVGRRGKKESGNPPGGSSPSLGSAELFKGESAAKTRILSTERDIRRRQERGDQERKLSETPRRARKKERSQWEKNIVQGDT